MADQLYLSYWLRGFSEGNMLRKFERLLRTFPFSVAASRPCSRSPLPAPPALRRLWRQLLSSKMPTALSW
jgi:hypothetical protein